MAHRWLAEQALQRKEWEINTKSGVIDCWKTDEKGMRKIVNTKVLMVATSIYLGLAGIGLTFLPQEIAKFFNTETDRTLILAFQILGSLYLGFAMTNWMTKNSPIGGIYNRPIVFGNLLHFLVSVIALMKMVTEYIGSRFMAMISIMVLYSIFTICFGYLLKTNPVKSQNVE